MMYTSTFSENIDVGTAQFMWEKSNFQQDVAEQIEAYGKRLKEEQSCKDVNGCITAAIMSTINRYKWIARQEVDSREKLDFMLWLFNGGKLRGENEIEIRLAVEERKEQAKKNFFIKNRRTYKTAQYKSGLICIFIFILMPALISFIWGGSAGLSAFLGLGAVPCLLLFSGALAFALYSVDKEYGYDSSVNPKQIYGSKAVCFADELKAYKTVK